MWPSWLLDGTVPRRARDAIGAFCRSPTVVVRGA